MTAPNDTSPGVAVSALSDRELHRRAKHALPALRKVQEAKRPNRTKLAVATEHWDELRTELATRVADGSWEAWDRLGFPEASSDRNTDGRGGVWHDRARDRFVAQLKHDGQRHRKVCSSRSEAEAWLDGARKRIAEGRSASESSWTVGGWLDHLLAEVWPREGLASRTLANHQAAVDRWWRPAVGGHRLVTLQPEDVDRVIGQIVAAGLSPNTVRIATAPLTKALGAALRLGYVSRNVASLATKPKLVNRRKSEFLDPAESRAVLAACPDARFGDAIALTMLLGLRRGEVLGLCWDRVDLDSSRPTVTIDRMLTSAKFGPVAGTKTGAKGVRTIVLPAAAVAVLRRRLERQRFEERAAEDGWSNPHGLVFTTTIGTPVDPDNFGKAVCALTERVVGRRVNPHALRHTAATLLHDAGVSMKVAQAILGHTTSAMTERVYTHVLDEQHDRAAEAIDALLAGT